MCCVVPYIDAPDLKKKPGIVCPNCVAAGCAIYEARPKQCGAYHCAWRQLGWLGDDWRPDISGVLIDFHDEGIPQYYRRPGLRLTIVGPPETVLKMGFLSFVDQMLSQSVPLFLCVQGPPGFHPAVTFLNASLQSPTSPHGLADALASIYRSAANFAFTPAEFSASA